MAGTVHKRCGCRDPDGRQLGAGCPDLAGSGHGRWGFRVDLGPVLDEHGVRRDRRRRSGAGFRSRKEAEKALAVMVARLQTGEPADRARHLTVDDDLDQWLEGKVNLRAATAIAYQSHVRLYLKPHLGSRRLAELRPEHVEAMYELLRQTSEQGVADGGRATGPATIVGCTGR